MKISDFDKVAKLKAERDSLIHQCSEAIQADKIEGYNIVNPITGKIVCAAWSDKDDTKDLFAAIRNAINHHFSTKINHASSALSVLNVELDDDQ